MPNNEAEQPRDMEQIDLRKMVHSRIDFTRVLLPIGWEKPLVVVRFLDGKKVERGLRFDTGKQTFLDHLDTKSKIGMLFDNAIRNEDVIGQIMAAWRTYVREKKREELLNEDGAEGGYLSSRSEPSPYL